ncbi:hypothetical protein [Shinella oryzae]|uniref:hypothetical protein n=1 Tax=Shinella oryzae TaxID=2871820 RepID=UPI003CCDE633
MPPDSTTISFDVSAVTTPADLPSRRSQRPLPLHLKDLIDRARGYVEAASLASTHRAYAADWKHFTAWCRRQTFLPPHPQVFGLYITACASGTAEQGGKLNSVSTILG